jgi:hypothetical protein
VEYARALKSMPGQSKATWTRRFAIGADAASFSLAVLALILEYFGGVRTHIGGMAISASSGARAFLVAIIIGIARHAVVPRPSAADTMMRGLRGLWMLASWLQRAVRDGAGTPAPALERPATREWFVVSMAIGIATAVMLRRQVLAFGSVPDLGDPLFSMWRLSWFAHQLPLDPRHLFDANIYYPAARTLAYSDAMLAPAAIAAPVLWLGVPVLYVYTTLMFAAFAGAGLAMFALARAVTGHTGAALVAAFMFAFDPFRFSHYSHLELQFTCWMPLALLALFRTLSSGRLRDGIWVGLFVSLQALSSLYYGAYLSVSLVFVTAGRMLSVGWPRLRAWRALGLGVLLAGAAAVLITAPYRANRSTVGERPQDEIRNNSATPRHYLTSSRRSVVYGASLYERQIGELELFTGAVPVVIATASLIPPLGPLMLPTAVGLVTSVEASFGLRGTLYKWLDALPLFRGFRVPARFRAVVGLYLSLLAGMGARRVMRFITGVWPERLVVCALAVAVMLDARPSIELQPLWTHAPDIYARVPGRAVLVDLPMLPNADYVYEYLSTFHWRPIINGTSGFEPAWYTPLASISRAFPADDTLDAFAKLGAQYFVIHEAYYRNTYARVVAAANAQPRLQFVAASTWEEGESRLYRLR